MVFWSMRCWWVALLSMMLMSGASGFHWWMLLVMEFSAIFCSIVFVRWKSYCMKPEYLWIMIWIPNRIQSYSYWISKENIWNSERELRRVTMEEWIGHSGTALCWLLKNLLQHWKFPALNWHCLGGSFAMQFESIPYASWGVRKTYSFISNKNTSDILYVLYLKYLHVKYVHIYTHIYNTSIQSLL